jgi:Cyclic nucleotide-binding domain
MRLQASVTAVSWIPSEAIPSPIRVPLDIGIAHYDLPPPDTIDDLEALRAADRFRFANELRAWIEVEEGRITAHGHDGRGHIGATRIRLGPLELAVPAAALPDIRPEPLASETAVRFIQTTGGRTGVAMPRPVKYSPYIQISSPLAWTTLALTIHADGTVEHELIGASPFPRHWVYDRFGRLVQKSVVIDFGTWFFDESEQRTPWGGFDSAALVMETETALERQLSRGLMQAAKPRIRGLKAGAVLCEQGEPETSIFLLLDGVLEAEVDGKPIASIGPGAILGERASLEGGGRTATLRATTPCRVAVMAPESLAKDALAGVAVGHHREEL